MVVVIFVSKRDCSVLGARVENFGVFTVEGQSEQIISQISKVISLDSLLFMFLGLIMKNAILIQT